MNISLKEEDIQGNQQFGDIFILNVDGFGCGQAHSNATFPRKECYSPLHDSETHVCSVHQFASTWKHSWTDRPPDFIALSLQIPILLILCFSCCYCIQYQCNRCCNKNNNCFRDTKEEEEWNHQKV